jgi:hypothetical protein
VVGPLLATLVVDDGFCVVGVIVGTPVFGDGDGDEDGLDAAVEVVGDVEATVEAVEEPEAAVGEVVPTQ